MSKGFEKKLFDVEVEMPHEDIQKLVKEYKKLKKYQKVFQSHTLKTFGISSIFYTL